MLGFLYKGYISTVNIYKVVEFCSYILNDTCVERQRIGNRINDDNISSMFSVKRQENNHHINTAKERKGREKKKNRSVYNHVTTAWKQITY